MATRRWTRRERVKHVQAWHASGQPARVYAARAKINVNTLHHWGWRLRQEGEALENAPVSSFDFVELPEPTPIVSDTSSIELVQGEVTLRIPGGFDAATLRRILDVVEERR